MAQDWTWCYENPKEAADYINDLVKERDELRTKNTEYLDKLHISWIEVKTERRLSFRQKCDELSADIARWKELTLGQNDLFSEMKARAEKAEAARADFIADKAKERAEFQRIIALQVAQIKAAQEQEPVAWKSRDGFVLQFPHESYLIPLYAAPIPQQAVPDKWQLRYETLRALLGESCPSELELNIAIAAAQAEGEK